MGKKSELWALEWFSEGSCDTLHLIALKLYSITGDVDDYYFISNILYLCIDNIVYC